VSVKKKRDISQKKSTLNLPQTHADIHRQKADKKWEKKAGQSCLILSIHLTEHTEITEFFQDIFLTKAMLSPMNPGALQAHLSNILG